MWVAGLCQNGFQNVLHHFSSENCHSMLGISTQTYFKISLQLAKQLAEYLKVHPLLKIQLMTNDPFELTFQKYSNDSLTSKVFLKDKKKSAMGRERKLSGRTKKIWIQQRHFWNLLLPQRHSSHEFQCCLLMSFMAWNLSALKSARYSENKERWAWSSGLFR